MAVRKALVMVADPPSDTLVSTSFTPVVAPPPVMVAVIVGSASPGLSATAGALLIGMIWIVAVTSALWLLCADPSLKVTAAILVA